MSEWFNDTLPAARDAGSNSASRFTSFGPTCPISGRHTAPLIPLISTKAARSSLASVMKLARSVAAA